MAWITPTGHIDPDGVWTTPALIYDNDVATAGQSVVTATDLWSSYIYLTHAALLCSAIRYYTLPWPHPGPVFWVTEFDIDVFYDAAWHDVYQGPDGKTGEGAGAWIEKDLPEGAKWVTQARVRYKGGMSGVVAYLAEFDFWDVPNAPVTHAASDIMPVSARLYGLLDDDGGLVCTGRFQWGRTPALGNDTAWQAGLVTGDSFSQAIAGLAPDTLYYFRAQANNANGTHSGEIISFWTSKVSVGKAYALSRPIPLKRTSIALAEGSIALATTTGLVNAPPISLDGGPASLTLTIRATYNAAATQGIKVHLRTSPTNAAIGKHTGADGAAALTDADAILIVNELVGLTIVNLTDNSAGIITANTATTVAAVLVGGVDNDWDNGDAYVIAGANYDTEDWDVWTPGFAAGTSIRQTEHYDVDPLFLKVLVENLDPAQTVTDVEVTATVGV